mgnify:CR=1 FL=1
MNGNCDPFNTLIEELVLPLTTLLQSELKSFNVNFLSHKIKALHWGGYFEGNKTLYE